MITANIHRPVRAEAESAGSSHWVMVYVDHHAHVTIFFETAIAAQIVADAINDAIKKDAK